MNAGIEDEEPEDHSADQIRQELHHVHAVHDKEDRGGDKGRAQIGHGNFSRVEDCDDDHGGKVVKNGKRCQKHLEA